MNAQIGKSRMDDTRRATFVMTHIRRCPATLQS
jgi:hypothetical protein